MEIKFLTRIKNPIKLLKKVILYLLGEKAPIKLIYQKHMKKLFQSNGLLNQEKKKLEKMEIPYL